MPEAAPILLKTSDHDRNSAGMRYVYPVVSRRAGGVSVGINLNWDNACNWRCLYCQVPDLRRGKAPPTDLLQLDAELHQMLDSIVHGDFMVAHVPAEMRRLNDIAFSGNGEPTTSLQLGAALDLVGRALAEYALLGQIRVVLITNGSQIGRAPVQQALKKLRAIHGEVWFKLDRAPNGQFNAVNQVKTQSKVVAQHLATAARLCPTWLQTCMFALDGQLPSEQEIAAWLAFVEAQLQSGVVLSGVLLYGLARPSLQPEAPRLSPAPLSWMQDLASRIELLGLPVQLAL